MMERRVVWLRRIVYPFVWFDVLWLTPWIRDHGRVPTELYRPLQIERMLHLPAPTPGLVNVVLVLLLACSALAALGRAPRLAGAAVFVLYLEWMFIAFSYGKVDHDRFTFLVALAVLPTVRLAAKPPGGAAPSDLVPALDAAERACERSNDSAWFAIKTVQVAAVLTYLLSVYAKHRFGGGLESWLDSTTLLRAVVRRGTFIGDALTHSPWILHAAQYGVVAMELLSPLLLVGGPIGAAMLVGVLLFHGMTFATVTILFLPHVVCLAAFVPLERLDGLVGALRARHLRPGQVLVNPDVAG